MLYVNDGLIPCYIGGKRIMPGETREVDIDVVPPAEPAPADEAPVTPDDDPP